MSIIEKVAAWSGRELATGATDTKRRDQFMLRLTRIGKDWDIYQYKSECAAAGAGAKRKVTGHAGSEECGIQNSLRQFISATKLGISAAAACLLLTNLASPAFAETKLNSVAVTVGDRGNPYFVQIVHGAEAQAKKFNPAVKFTAESSNYDVNRQSNQVDNFISSQDQLLILNAADSKGIAPAVGRAKAAHMTVVAVDVTANGGVDATVTSDNRQAGELDGQYVANRLKGKGNVVIVNGPPVSAVQDRVAGFLEVMKRYPGIHILSQDQNAGGSRDGGLRVMTDLLTAFPKIDTVFAINDPTAIGCGLAAKQAGRTDFFIVSVDGSPDIVPYLKNPKSLIVATAAQDPYAMAEKAVTIGYNIMNGKKPAQEPTLIPVQLVTKKNVADYKGWSK